MQMRGRKSAEGFLTTVILIGKSIVGRIKMNCESYYIEAKKGFSEAGKAIHKPFNSPGCQGAAESP